MTAVTSEELPARVNIRHAVGSSFSRTITIAQDMTGYTFAGAVVKGGAETAFTIVVNDLSPTVELVMSLTVAQINTLGVGAYSWYMAWTSGTTVRRFYSGDYAILDKDD
jgi:hypothetical protein